MKKTLSALVVVAILALLPGAFRSVTGAFAVLRRLGRRWRKRPLPVDESGWKPLGAAQPVIDRVEGGEKEPAMVR